MPHKTTRRRHQENLTEIFTRNTWIVGKAKHRRNAKTAREAIRAQKRMETVKGEGGTIDICWYRWAAKDLLILGFLGRKSIKSFIAFRCNEVHKQNYVGM